MASNNRSCLGMKKEIMRKYFGLIFLLIGCVAFTFGQESKNLVQFSGLVLEGSGENLYPVPYTNILVKGKRRGTYSDFKGFFSIVVQKSDTIIFSAVGYETVEFIIPDDLEDDRYSLVQMMTQNPYDLPETVVFPWPSREHFKLEFLAMDVTPELQKIASRNLSDDALRKVQNSVLVDSDESNDYYLRQQSRNNYYIGQQPPMNIFNPIAWKKFFDAWKRGDFKKNKKKK